MIIIMMILILIIVVFKIKSSAWINDSGLVTIKVAAVLS